MKNIWPRLYLTCLVLFKFPWYIWCGGFQSSRLLHLFNYWNAACYIRALTQNSPHCQQRFIWKNLQINFNLKSFAYHPWLFKNYIPSFLFLVYREVAKTLKITKNSEKAVENPEKGSKIKNFEIQGEVH